MEKTEEIKRYLKYQTKIRAIRIAEELGHKYACEVFGISKTVSLQGMFTRDDQI